jgi:hypothetical protein
MSLIRGGRDKSHDEPDGVQKLTSEAQAFRTQLLALTMIEEEPNAAVELLNRPSELVHLRSPATKNLLAVARLAQTLDAAKKEQKDFDSIRLQPELVQDIADELAKTSVEDPSNLIILDNLVDSDAKCNPVDSIGSSTKSRVSLSERPPSARFPGDKDGSARRNIEPLQ